MRVSQTMSAMVVLLVGQASAAPPELNIPTEVTPANGYAIVRPKTDAKAVSYIALSGVYGLPSELLADKRMFVLPVQGLAAGRYRFVAVGSLNDEHAQVEFTVVVGNAPPVPPGPTPGPVDPVDPDPELTRLAAKIKTAAGPDFAKWRELAAGLDACGTSARTADTGGGFYAIAREHLKMAVSGERLPDALSAVLGEETAKVLPSTAGAWTDANRTAAFKLYSRLSKAVRQAGGIKP